MPGDLFPDDEWDGESGPPGADGPGPAGQGAAPLPDCFDAGFFPRGTAATPGDGPGPRRPGRFGPGAGFAAGDVLDTAMPGPALAGFIDAAAGTGRAYADLNDDELIGTLVASQKTEAWAAAGRLSAVAELIRRRPGADNAPPPPQPVPEQPAGTESAPRLALRSRPDGGNSAPMSSPSPCPPRGGRRSGCWRWPTTWPSGSR
jgi:hypothetical protein